MKTNTAKKPSTAVTRVGNSWTIHVRTLMQMVNGLRDLNVDLEPNTDDNLRHLAESVGVPFFVLRLLDDNNSISEWLADLDDIEQGLAWLDAHHVPRDLLRRSRPRQIEWMEGVKQLEAEAAEKKHITEVAGIVNVVQQVLKAKG